MGRTIVRIHIPLSYSTQLIVFQVGRLDSDKLVHIRLSGDNILEEHCYFDNDNGLVTLQAPAGSVTVSIHFQSFLC
jgi:kinesin family protein 1